MKPFMEVFKESLDRSFKTWPLYAWQTGFEVLRIVTLIPCIVILFVPLLKTDADFAGGDFSKLSDTLVELLWNSGWWMLAAGMFLLYMVWWLIIEAIINGAVFGRLWAYVKRKETFDLGKYFREGFRYFPPLIGLHLLTLVVMVVLAALAGLFVAGLAYLAAGMGMSKGVTAVVLAFPTGLVVGLVMVFIAVWWLVARGYITTDHGMAESLRLSYRKCLDDKGRVFWGINLLLVLIFAVLMAVGMVFGVLQAIPLIGLVFSLANMVVSILSAAFLAVYVPSVVVAFLEEKG